MPDALTKNTPERFTYSRWRHGGWYVHDVRYPSGAIGCVSNNYADKKWRIACDPRPFDEQPTFKNRDEAARAEFLMAENMKKPEPDQKPDLAPGLVLSPTDIHNRTLAVSGLPRPYDFYLTLGYTHKESDVVRQMDKAVALDSDVIPRIVACVNACTGVADPAAMRRSLERCAFLLDRIAEGDHKALEKAHVAAQEVRVLLDI